MSQRLTFVAVCIITALATVDACEPLSAKDYFLTIGGGYDVTGNQLSLERNVIFQQSVLAAKRPDKPAHEVWFADGDDPHPDLQCRDPKFEENCPTARRMLAELLGDADSMDLFYRSNEVPEPKGPSDLNVVRDRFRKLAGEVKPGDRVVIYVAGHGGRAKGPARGGRRASAPPANPFNTCFYFWNTQPVTASEFNSWLDRFPAGAEVLLVMVQCYAGGFSHTIFNDADAKKGLADHARCGFFAQLHDRAAAGCTPDANEADYEEYSSYFWGALAGKSRAGVAVSSADYNQDGRVSFAEAHSYAMIESDTIDVPVRTSGALLREFSSADSRAARSRSNRNAGAEDATSVIDAEYAEMKGPIAALKRACRADRQAILDQLPVKIGVGSAANVEDVTKRLNDVSAKIRLAEDKLAGATKTRRAKLKSVRADLYATWPELRSEYAPLAIELVTDRADEFVRYIKSLPDYQALCEAKEKEDEFSQAALKLEREKARCERLLETCEDAVLAANLPLVAPADILKRYEQILTLEEFTLSQ